MTDTREALACPFCGGKPTLIAFTERDGFVRSYAVHCDECAIEQEAEYEDDAIAAWNRRAAPVERETNTYNGEEWERLAMALASEEHDDIHHLIWEGGPVPTPWGEVWQRYEGDAKRLIALVREHVPTLTPAAPAVKRTPYGPAIRGDVLIDAERLDLSFHLRTARMLAELNGEAILSEQQCARHMRIDLVSWRKLVHCFAAGTSFVEGDEEEFPAEDSESILRAAIASQETK